MVITNCLMWSEGYEVGFNVKSADEYLFQVFYIVEQMLLPFFVPLVIFAIVLLSMQGFFPQHL